MLEGDVEGQICCFYLKSGGLCLLAFLIVCFFVSQVGAVVLAMQHVRHRVSLSVALTMISSYSLASRPCPLA